MNKIQMVDLQSQYKRLKPEIDQEIQEVINTASFIKGPVVEDFESMLAEYLGVSHVIGCANGTDALQIAMMAAGLEKGDEVIVPSFTYVATAEVIGLLGLTPVLIDVNPDSFTIDINQARKAITPRTKAIVPVHLYGQCAQMEELLSLASNNGLIVIEDTAQAIGSTYTFSDGRKGKAGTMGDIGCISFFPSKNLGCYGDGGALVTNNSLLAEKARVIANHGQKKKYHHDVIGVNSRLDSMQAAVLKVKLPHLSNFSQARYDLAQKYKRGLGSIKGLLLPQEMEYSSHVYHQFTIKVLEGKRDGLKSFLATKGIPSMVYYPIPLDMQEAFKDSKVSGSLHNTYELCKQVLSIPMHTEMPDEQANYIIMSIKSFFNGES